MRSLVLAGTGAGGPEPRAAARPRARGVRGRAATCRPRRQRRATLPYTFSPGWTEANPERFEEILAATLEHPTPRETIAAHMDACYRFYDEAIEVERIDVPALVIHGDEDLIVPVENGRELARRLPNARYVELRAAGTT